MQDKYTMSQTQSATENCCKRKGSQLLVTVWWHVDMSEFRAWNHSKSNTELHCVRVIINITTIPYTSVYMLFGCFASLFLVAFSSFHRDFDVIRNWYEKCVHSMTQLTQQLLFEVNLSAPRAWYVSVESRHFEHTSSTFLLSDRLKCIYWLGCRGVLVGERMYEEANNSSRC